MVDVFRKCKNGNPKEEAHHEENANLIQGGQNIQSLLICGLGNVSVYDLLNANCVVLTKDCVKALEGGLK